MLFFFDSELVQPHLHKIQSKHLFSESLQHWTRQPLNCSVVSDSIICIFVLSVVQYPCLLSWTISCVVSSPIWESKRWDFQDQTRSVPFWSTQTRVEASSARNLWDILQKLRGRRNSERCFDGWRTSQTAPEPHALDQWRHPLPARSIRSRIGEVRSSMISWWFLLILYDLVSNSDSVVS